MSEYLKVLWIVTSYPRSSIDSASIFLGYLADAITNLGIKLHVLLPDTPSLVASTSNSIALHPFRYIIPRRFQRLAYGSGILPNLKSNPMLSIQVPGFLSSMYVKGWSLCRRLKPDLIHCHWIFPCGTIGVSLGRWFDLPVIVTAHGGDAFALNGPVFSGIKRWTLANATAWTSNTYKTATAALGKGISSSLEVIPMGVDFKRFATPIRTEIPYGDTSKQIVLFVGRLVEKKGVFYLLRALAMLMSKGKKDLELWIVGDGMLRPNLETKARSLGIAHIVRFWGRIPHDELPAFYAKADIFVAPSIVDEKGDTEGQGVVFLEAMSSKTPVIGTLTGGISEVIEDGKEGFLVPQRDVKALSKAMETLLCDRSLREKMAQNAQLKARHYDWSNIGRKFVDLYWRVTEKW